jgi:hypothetical protein
MQKLSTLPDTWMSPLSLGEGVLQQERNTNRNFSRPALLTTEGRLGRIFKPTHKIRFILRYEILLKAAKFSINEFDIIYSFDN